MGTSRWNPLPLNFWPSNQRRVNFDNWSAIRNWNLHVVFESHWNWFLHSQVNEFSVSNCCSHNMLRSMNNAHVLRIFEELQATSGLLCWRYTFKERKTKTAKYNKWKHLCWERIMVNKKIKEMEQKVLGFLLFPLGYISFSFVWIEEDGKHKSFKEILDNEYEGGYRSLLVWAILYQVIWTSS